MLLFDDNQNKILSIVLEKPFCTTNDIISRLTKEGVFLSKSQIYLILQKLITKQIIKKNKGNFIVHPIYLEKINEISKAFIYNDFANKEVFPGMRKIIKLSSFIETNVLRPYYVSLISQITGATKWLSCQHHDPYVLSEIEKKETQPNLHLPIRDIEYYNIFSWSTKLDKFYEKNNLFSQKGKNIYQKRIHRNILSINQYSIQIFDDYVVEIFCDKKFMDNIENYFNNYDETTHQPEILQAILFEKMPCIMVIEHNPNKALKRSRRILRLFK